MSDTLTKQAKHLVVGIQTRDWIGTLKPIDVFLNYRYLSIPSGAVDAANRIEKNPSYFLSNYGLVLLVTYFYTILFTHALRFSFLFLFILLIGLEYIKQKVFVVGQYTIDHSLRLMVATGLLVFLVFWTAGFEVVLITLVTLTFFLLHTVFHVGATVQSYVAVSQNDDELDVEAGQLNMSYIHKDSNHLAPATQSNPHSTFSSRPESPMSQIHKDNAPYNPASPPTTTLTNSQPPSSQQSIPSNQYQQPKPALSIYDAYAASLAAAGHNHQSSPMQSENLL